MKNIASLIVIITGLIFTACGSGGIEGTWKPDTSSLEGAEKKEAEAGSMTFKSDGTGSLGQDGSIQFPFKWKKDGDELMITMEIFGRTNENRSKFKVSGKTLIIYDKEGDKTVEKKFHRK